MAINIATIQKAALNAVPALQKTLLSAAAFSTDFSSDVVSPGASVLATVVGKPTAAAEFETSFSASADGDTSVHKIELSKLYHKTFKLSRRQQLDAESGSDVLDKLVSANMIAVAEKFLSDPISDFSKANLGAPIHTKTPAAFSFKDVVAIKTAGTKADLPTSGRKLILNSEAHDAMLGDDKVSNIVNVAIATGAVSNGVLPRLAGMDVYEMPTMPEVDNAVGFLLLPQAVALVARAYEPVDGNDSWTTVVEPQTGLPMTLKSWSNPDTEEVYFSVILNAGWKLLQKDAVKRITSVADAPQI